MMHIKLIEILDDFHAALVSIQHALNAYNAPAVTLEELKKRVTTANDSFVAMAVSEVWESVDSTLKCVNLALDLCDFIDSFDFPFNANAEWYAHYRSAEETIRSIHSKLSEIAIKEYNLI